MVAAHAELQSSGLGVLMSKSSGLGVLMLNISGRGCFRDGGLDGGGGLGRCLTTWPAESVGSRGGGRGTELGAAIWATVGGSDAVCGSAAWLLGFAWPVGVSGLMPELECSLPMPIADAFCGFSDSGMFFVVTEGAVIDSAVAFTARAFFDLPAN